ncbi:MAG: glycosyltransferase family 4 protein [Crocinitomicaceae bacterium]
MLSKPRIVFLYSEIAGYFLACAKVLASKADVLIVRWPVNSEAPFQFENVKGLEIVCKTDFNIDDLTKKVRNFDPSTIVCSGWMDKDYLRIVKSFKKEIPSVLTLDNHWTGSLKQRVASILSPFILKDKFTHAWVPGKPQVKFAKSLGFKNIVTGFYCADVDLHSKNYFEGKVKKTKQFLYVGRYVKQKAIFEMWQAFINLIEENKITDWEMICAGTGDLFEERIVHPKIKHLGFVQPSELSGLLQNNPIYILPSSSEPWGVSVQEFAIAGCPLIISNAVGAAELFLENDLNGFAIQPTVTSIKSGMKKMMDLSEDGFNKMRKESHIKGMAYTPSEWAERLLDIRL